MHIPKEIYELGPIFSYLPDRNGKQICLNRERVLANRNDHVGCVPIYVRIKFLIKHDENAFDLEHKMKQLFAVLMDKVDNEVRRPRGWSLVFDCQDAGIENANFDLMFFALDIIAKYFPLQPKYVLAHGVPWLLRPLVTIGLNMLPPEARDLLTFADNQEQLLELFDSSNVPDFMGGSATKPYNEIPPGAKNIFDLGREMYNLSESEVRRLVEPMAHLIKLDSASSQRQSDGKGGAKKHTSSFIEEFD